MKLYEGNKVEFRAKISCMIFQLSKNKIQFEFEDAKPIPSNIHIAELAPYPKKVKIIIGKPENIARLKQIYYEMLEQFEGLLSQLVEGEECGWDEKYQKKMFKKISEETEDLRKQLEATRKEGRINYEELVIK